MRDYYDRFINDRGKCGSQLVKAIPYIELNMLVKRFRLRKHRSGDKV